MSTFTPIGAYWSTNAYNNSYPYNGGTLGGSYINLGSYPRSYNNYYGFYMYGYANGTSPLNFSAYPLNTFSIDSQSGYLYGYYYDSSPSFGFFVTVSNTWRSQTVFVLINLY
jgi:hypothetical protein